MEETARAFDEEYRAGKFEKVRRLQNESVRASCQYKPDS
jgi:hypothetical protein